MSEPIFPIKAKYEESDREHARTWLQQASNGIINDLANREIITLQEMGLVRTQELVKAHADALNVYALEGFPQNKIEGLSRGVSEEMHGVDTARNEQGVEAIEGGLIAVNMEGKLLPPPSKDKGIE